MISRADDSPEEPSSSGFAHHLLEWIQISVSGVRELMAYIFLEKWCLDDSILAKASRACVPLRGARPPRCSLPICPATRSRKLRTGIENAARTTPAIKNPAGLLSWAAQRQHEAVSTASGRPGRTHRHCPWIKSDTGRIVGSADDPFFSRCVSPLVVVSFERAWFSGRLSNLVGHSLVPADATCARSLFVKQVNRRAWNIQRIDRADLGRIPASYLGIPLFR